MPGGVWRIAFSIRLSTSRCRSSRRPARSPGSASIVSSWSSATGPSSAAASVSTSARSVGRGGCIALGVGAREQQQVADEPAHPPRRAQRRLGGLGLLAVELVGEQLEVGEHARQRRAQLVRGVGDELALAVEHRLGLAARGVERAEHPLQRPRELGDLVVGLGRGEIRGSGRACARSRAPASVSSAIGRIARRAVAEAGEQGEDRAAEHAEDEEERTSAIVWSTSESGRA